MSTTRIEELLGEDSGIHRRIFMLIDGHEPILWQYSDRPIPTHGFYRSGINCLDPPGAEYSMGLSLSSMKVDPTSTTIKLENILDPNDATKWYFSTLFAPGRWTGSDSKYALVAIEDYTDAAKDNFLKADATEIFVDRDISAWPSSGTAYIGSETLSYSGIAAVGGSDTAKYKLTGVTRGVYPMVGTTWAETFRLTRIKEQPAADEILISTVPYSWIGRRVGIYVTAWDPSKARYLGFNESLLIWAGRLNSEITYVPTEDRWNLVAESLIKDLERKIVRRMPEADFSVSESAPMINLQGTQGRSFTLEKHQWNTGLVPPAQSATSKIVLTVPAGKYTVRSLMGAIATQLVWAGNNPGSWTVMNNYLAGSGFETRVGINRTSDNKTIFHSLETSLTKIATEGAVIYPWYAGVDCHALMALGFDAGQPIEINVDIGNGKSASKVSEERYNIAYHPLSPKVNGGKFMCDVSAASAFLTQNDRPDDTSDIGYIQIDDCLMEPGGESVKCKYLAAWSSVTEVDDLYAEFTLDTTCMFGNKYLYPWSAYIGERANADKRVKVKSIYGVASAAESEYDLLHGPFEKLLFPLLSTGTPGFNHATYDKMAPEISCAIDANLVDTDSFLEADSKAFGIAPDLYKRAYPISKAVTMSDMISREGQLFGYFLGWDRGRLRLKKAFVHNVHLATVEINDSNSAELMEFPDVRSSIDTAMNHWTVTAYNHMTDKTRDIEIADVNSISGLAVSKTVKIDHPGIDAHRQSADSLTDMLNTLLIERRDMQRYPWQVIRRTLKPSMAYKVFIGDIVRYTASNHPDPYGYGGMDVDAQGIVIDKTLNLTDWTSGITILLYSRYLGSLKHAYGGCALIDKTAANGGWDNVTKKLTLIPHEFGYSDTEPKDGTRFVATDRINIIERSAFDPTAPQNWLNLTVQTDFDTTNDELELAAGTTLAGFDATGDTEYIIVPGDYDIATTAQQDENTYLADSDLKTVDGDPPHRFG